VILRVQLLVDNFLFSGIGYRDVGFLLTTLIVSLDLSILFFFAHFFTLPS